jgi:hypothetical protein
MTAFGTMECVAINDLGDLGPTRGEAVQFSANPAGSALAYAPWVLILGLLMIRENRRRAAWLVFIPLVIFNILASYAFSFMGQQGYLFSLMTMDVAFSLAAWWLLIHPKIMFRGWLASAVAALVMFEIVSNLSYFSGWAREIPQLATMSAIAYAAVMVAVLITSRRVRPAPTMSHIMAWLGVCMIFTMIVGMMGLFVVITVSEGRQNILQGIKVLSVAGLVMGLILNILTQPFMILAWKNQFWRERMRWVFRLKEAEAGGEKPAEVLVVEKEKREIGV